MMFNRVLTGLDVLIKEKFSRLSGKRLAVLAHAASCNSQLKHVIDLLVEANLNVERILAPEHGFRGEAQDMIPIQNSRDSTTGIEIASLYGHTEDSLQPKTELLKDIDLLLVDLQDVGARYYTYAQSMALCMISAKKAGVKVIILDRPNPIGGKIVEGSPLEKSCRSFCGMLPVPNRHGLTIGELAILYNLGFGAGENTWEGVNCALEVVKMDGWKRQMIFSDTKLPWIMPSPNMPTLDTSLVYTGVCLIEATNLSEGRGTTRPFELIGAPFIKPQQWYKKLDLDLTSEHLALRETSFLPQFQKQSGKPCFGMQLHILDPHNVRSYKTGLTLIKAAFSLYRETDWRHEAYEFVRNIPAIDLLYGSSKFRESIEKDLPLKLLFEEQEDYERDFLKNRKPFLLYQ